MNLDSAAVPRGVTPAGVLVDKRGATAALATDSRSATDGRGGPRSATERGAPRGGIERADQGATADEPAESTSAGRAPLLVRRVVMGIDAADPGQTSLAAAVVLAERLHAELHGLFIEDANLHRLAALPFAVELQLPTGVGRPLQAPVLQSELRALASGARQAVATAASRAQVSWSFQVRRGPMAATALLEAGELDLLLLPSARRLRQRVSGPQRRRAGGGARGGAERTPVFAIFDEGEGAERVLTTASCLAEGQERPLRVLSLASGASAARLLQERAALWLSARGLEAEGLTLPGARSPQVGALVRAAGGGLVALSAGCPLLEGRALSAVQEELCGPLLLVR